MKERYERNIGVLAEAEQELLETKRAAIVGCGGLGCYVAEHLARFGLGHLTLIDGDSFAASNLNRQLNSLETNLGKNKASETRKRLLNVRSDLSMDVLEVFLNEENAGKLLNGHDVIIDALDNVKTRMLIEKTADKLGIPLVHGAVKGWDAQVCVVFPGDFILSKLYPTGGESKKPSVISVTPAFCASLQAAETIKVLLNKENVLRKKILIANLKYHSYDIIDLIT
jgi:molybdopterin/thiamine biosynthesis adenylyltransferase